MKVRYAFLIVIFFSSNLSFAQEKVALKFIPDLKEGKKIAESEDKFIFVNVFAKWMEPCDEMAKAALSDAEVVDFFSNNFVPVSIDADQSGRNLIAKYKIINFPTYLYLNPDGKLVHQIEGCANKERLLSSAKISLKNPKKKAAKFRADYRKYSKNPEYLKDYVRFCEDIEDYELADKLTDQYAKQISEVDSLEWMDFVMQYVHKENSKLFDLLKDNRIAFNELYGKKIVDQVFLDIIINGELWKMNNPSTEKLLKKTTKKIDKYKLQIEDEQLYPAIASRVFSKEIVFENDQGRADLAVRILEDYSAEADLQYLPAILASIAIQQEKKSILSLASDQIDKLISMQPNTSLYDINSIILYKLGEKEESYRQVALAQQYAVAHKQKYRSSLKVMKDSGMIK